MPLLETRKAHDEFHQSNICNGKILTEWKLNLLDVIMHHLKIKVIICYILV